VAFLGKIQILNSATSFSPRLNRPRCSGLATIFLTVESDLDNPIASEARIARARRESSLDGTRRVHGRLFPRILRGLYPRLVHNIQQICCICCKYRLSIQQ
jgi:hypothetical protein